jgi:hypothetical protein
MNQRLEDRILSLVSRLLVAITVFLLTMLWSRVDDIEKAGEARDKELAAFMLEIEHRITMLEARNR